MISFSYNQKDDIEIDEEISYAGRKVLIDRTAVEYVVHLIEKGAPFAIVRFGETENRVVNNCHHIKFPVLNPIKNRKLYNTYFYNFCEGAGFFPKDVNYIPRYTRKIQNYMRDVDVIAINGWNKEEEFIENNCKGATLIKSRALNFFFWQERPWTKGLEGKKVLIISPFADTIKKQYLNRKMIWDREEILPEFILNTYKPVQQFKELNSKNYRSWFKALERMVTEINSIDFDVAILGCGAYGMPLACEIKKSGRSAIHLAANTQLLFGIMGKRWDEDERIMPFVNKYWTRPSEEETPQKKHIVEGGCYW